MTRNSPENPLRCEQEMDTLWGKVEAELGFGETSLLQQSTLDRARRIYKKEEYVYKVVLVNFEISSHIRNCTLASEYAFLSRCSFTGVPVVVGYDTTTEYEFVVFEYIAGSSLADVTLSWVEVAALLCKLFLVIVKLARAGISHNDIKEENIIVAPDTLYLIDFDQATQSGFWKSCLSNLTGIHFGRKNMVYGSLARVAKEQVKKVITPRRITIIKKMLGRYDKEHTLPVIPENGDPQLHTLLEAWKLAQPAAASSPWELKAYYSLELGEYYFPGERPWINRWNVLQGITSFAGKRVLELGCNMGLLSTFLVKEKGAIAAMGIDIDKDILHSADLVSRAFGVDVSHKQVNFDAPGDWETELAGFQPDIVFALNVLNWVEDKQRLMRFLGRFPEVIFEGHDDVETESSRFKAVGFTKVELVSMTERKRPVLHCRK